MRLLLIVNALRLSYIEDVEGDATITIVYTKSLKAAYSSYDIIFEESYMFNTATGWTTSTSGRYDPIIAEADGDFYMTVNQESRNNNGATLTGSQLKNKVDAGNDFTLLFDIQLAAAKDRESDITTFTINDKANSAAILKFTASATGSTTWKINNSETATTTMTWGTWYTVKLTRKGAKTYLTITNTSTGTDVFGYALVPTLSETGGLGNMILTTTRYKANLAMDNILVREVVPTEDVFSVYNVKAVAGEEEIATLASGRCTPGEDYSVQLSKVISSEGKYYVLDDAIKSFKQTYTMGGDDEVKTITYTEDPTIVYYTEGTPSSYMNVVSDENCSGGSYMTTNTSANHGNARNRGYGLSNLSAGQYEITASIVKNNGRRICVRINAGGYNTGNNPLVTLSGKGVKTGVFVLGIEKDIVITGPNSGDADGNKSTHMEDFDYIIVRKTGNTALNMVKITDAGYATYYSDCPLDFTGTGLKAYIATVDSKNISFQEVTSVPANTGILLKGDADTYLIPVDDSDTDVTSNAFIGSLIYTKVNDPGIFVLKNGDEGVGFYKTTQAFTIGANTAYLPASVAEGRTFIGFSDDETTGISTTLNGNGEMTNNKSVYNLNGQRVGQPTKGLYIVNGKKVIVK